MPARARSLALRFCPPLRYSKRALLLHRYHLLAQQLHRRAQKGHRIPNEVGYGLIFRVTSFSTYPMTEIFIMPAGTP